MLRLGTFVADVLALLAGTASKVIAHATIDSTVIGGSSPSTATFTTLSLTGSQTQAVVLAAPAGAAGAPTFRLLALTDLPTAAPLASPPLTGTPTAPTAAPGTNTTQLATAAFTAAAVAVETARAAPKASPNFTGNLLTTASNSGGNGTLTVSNPFTAAGTSATFQAVTGSPNAYLLVALTDGATPTAAITTGSGVTGGLVLNPAVGGVTIVPPATLASATFGSTLGAKINLYGTLGAAGSYGVGVNSGEVALWTGGSFTLRNSSVTAGLSAPIIFQVAQNGTATTNALLAGTGANPYSASVATSSLGHAYSGLNTTTGTADNYSNFVSTVSGSSAQMRHLLMSSYNGSTYTVVGSITSSTTTTAFNTTSDYRLKTDVQPLEGSRSRVMALKPSSFAFTADPTRRQHGFLAHEFAAAMPDAGGVTGEKDGESSFIDVVMLGHSPVAADVTEAAWATGMAEGTYDKATQWHADITVPVHQALDASKCLPDLVATVQGLVRQVNDLSNRVAALSTQAAMRGVSLPPMPSKATPEQHP